MNLDTLLQILKLGTEHDYIAIAVLVTGYLTSLTSDWSKFPITVPKRYQPLIVLVVGQAYAVFVVIKDGTPWRTAVMGGLLASFTTMGLYAIVVKAIFDGNVPSWLAWISFVKPDAAKADTLPPNKAVEGARDDLLPPPH